MHVLLSIWAVSITVRASHVLSSEPMRLLNTALFTMVNLLYQLQYLININTHLTSPEPLLSLQLSH